MALTNYNQGDQVELTVSFYNSPAKTVKADPTEITLRIRKPDGGLLTYVYGNGLAISKSGTGDYSALVDIDQPGHWYYRWEGKGTIVVAEDDEFFVPASPVFGRRR